jgi:hypothetical protein
MIRHYYWPTPNGHKTAIMLKGNQLLCHQSIAGQQVSINDIILAQYADTFSELPNPTRVNQVDRRTLAVKKLHKLLVIDFGWFNNEGE